MFSFINKLFEKKSSPPPVITAEELDRNRTYGPPYAYLIDENLELWRGRSHPDENMHWSKLSGMHNDGSPCWVLSRTDCPVSHKMHNGIGVIFAAEDSEMQKTLIGIFGRRTGNTYPNPLNIGLGFGRIKLALFHSGGSHGILLQEVKVAGKVGEMFYGEDEEVSPQPGHVYLTCHSVESAIVLRDMANRVIHSFPVADQKSNHSLKHKFEPYWVCAEHSGEPLGCVELLASANQDLIADPVFAHFAAEIAQKIAGDEFDITAGLWGARIVYSTNSRIPKDVIHKMADTIVTHKAWVGLCAAVSVLESE